MIVTEEISKKIILRTSAVYIKELYAEGVERKRHKPCFAFVFLYT